MPERFYVKTSPSSWEQIRNLYVKTSPSSWAAVIDAWVKVSSTLWKQFWSSPMSPSQVVEIIGSTGGLNGQLLRLQGKNYVWSPTPQSLRYYFRQVNIDGTTYVGPGGSSGSTASNTISTYPSSTTYELINNEDFEYKIGGWNKYFFEVRATGASGTVYSSISADTSAPSIYSPLAPTLTEVSKTSTSVTIKITAAADTTGTWGFSSWGATYRYIIYTYDSVNGFVYSGGGRGGVAASTSEQNFTLTGLVSGRQYDVYVMPTTGNSGSRPFPYNSSTETNGYSGYEGLEGYISITPGSDYVFSFGNSLYVSTNGYIGLDTAGSSDALPTSGKFLSILPADLQQDTTTSIWYWSDTSQYVIRWEGYNFGNSSATKIYQATFYSGQSYADVRAITVNGTAAGTTAYYKNGVVQSSYPSALSTNSQYRVYFDTTAPTAISVAEKNKSIMKQVSGLTSGSTDVGYTTLVTATNQVNFTAGTIKITGGSTETTNGFVSAGTTLTVVANNDWPAGTTFTYQWYRTREIEGIQPISAGTASTATSSAVGEDLYCVVSYSNSGTTGTVYSNSYLIVPAAPSYTLTGNTNGSFTISSVSTTGGSFYYGSYTKDSGSSISISRTSTSTNTTVNSGAGSIAVRLYGSANITYSGNGTPTQINGWEYTDKTATVTSDVRASGSMRRVSLPANFTNSSQTVWVGTNGYVSVTVDPTTSPGTTWPTAGGAVVGPGVADLVQSSLDYKADSSNFYVYWKGYRLGDTSKELWYLMKFYWNSTTVDVYFERYTLTDGSLDAVRNGNTQYSTWANSTSITGMSIPTGMTSSTTNNGVDDNRTAITATKPALNLTTNPAYGSGVSKTGGWTATISTAPNPTGGTYSVVSYTAGTAPTINSSTGALDQTGLSAGSSSTVTVRYSLSGYNSVDITASGSASAAASGPTVTSIGYVPLGNLGTLYTSASSNFTGSIDDGYWTFNLPFNIKYNGTNYSTIYVGTNSYITFGGGSTAYGSQITASNPPYNKVLVYANDRGSNSCYFYSTSSVWNVKLNAGSGTAAGTDIQWEAYGISDATSRLDITIVAGSGGTTGAYTASSLINSLGGNGTAWRITSQ